LLVDLFEPIYILWNTCTMEYSLGNTALMLLKQTD